MDRLKLIALDKEDIEVVSAHLQDAVVKAADIRWRPAEKRLVIALNRFDWEKAGERGANEYRRRRTALRFDRVFGAQLRNLKQGKSDRILSLLAVHFEPDDPPGGHVTLTFSGDASIQLKVECIEAELTDLGPEWRTRFKPEHPGAAGEPAAGDEPSAGSGPGKSGS